MQSRLPSHNLLGIFIIVHYHCIQPPGSSLVLQLLHHCVSIAGEFTYWSRAVIPPNPTFIVNTVPFQEPRLIYPLEGSAVSATSYALLVYLANNRIEEATSIMKWLQTMRNSIGGWGSTQVHSLIIARQPSYGKVMFSVVCVRLSVQTDALPCRARPIPPPPHL